MDRVGDLKVHPSGPLGDQEFMPQKKDDIQLST